MKTRLFSEALRLISFIVLTDFFVRAMLTSVMGWDASDVIKCWAGGCFQEITRVS